MDEKRQPQAFSVRCKSCDTVAESWHEKFRIQAPDEATFGMAYCLCGKTGADSSDRPGIGRISGRRSEHGEP